MRTAGLLTLALFFPIFASAAAPVLDVYTISNGTIYPSATAGSGFATTTAIDVAFSETVKASIKIVSAGGVVVNPFYSSSSVKNPNPKIWDGTSSSGIKVADGVYTILVSATSTDGSNISMTDSSRTVTVASVASDSSDSSDASSSPDASSDTITTSPANGAPPEYMPIPTLLISAGGSRTISTGADVPFTALVYDGRGNKRDDALVTWSFGDGMQKTGASIFHQYYEPGEYLAVVHASTSDGGTALAEIVVTVKNAGITIVSASSRGIALMNGDSRTLDLSLWHLSAGGREFTIPADTHLLAGRTVLFPSQIIELPVADTASLLYPSGEVAATYPASAASPTNVAAQPSPAAPRYEQVQTVDSITSAETNLEAHDEAVIAPAAATELAAAGAALAPSETAPPAAARAGVSGLLRSPWTLGLLGVIAVAGGAFIFL